MSVGDSFISMMNIIQLACVNVCITASVTISVLYIYRRIWQCVGQDVGRNGTRIKVLHRVIISLYFSCCGSPTALP